MGTLGGDPLNATDALGLWPFRPRPDNRQPVSGAPPTLSTPTPSDRAPGTREAEDRGSGQPPPISRMPWCYSGLGNTHPGWTCAGSVRRPTRQVDEGRFGSVPDLQAHEGLGGDDGSGGHAHAPESALDGLAQRVDVIG